MSVIKATDYIHLLEFFEKNGKSSLDWRLRKCNEENVSKSLNILYLELEKFLLYY